MSDGTHLNYLTRQRAVNAVHQGMSATEVALVYGVDRKTITRWLTRYREGGPDALDRRIGSGRPRIGEHITEDQLRTIVLRRPTDCGFETDLWTVARFRRVLAEEFQLAISKNTMWRRLREAGLTYQKPEREYYEIDPVARSKWIRYEVPRIRRAVREYRGVLYFQDESNISLSALLGKTWSKCGQTPKAKVTGKRAGVAAMSAISRQGQLLFRLWEKRIASPEVIAFLDQLVKHHPGRHVVVVMDQAPPHTSHKTQAWIASQPRLHVFHLPKYSPDWNPDEKSGII